MFQRQTMLQQARTRLLRTVDRELAPLALKGAGAGIPEAWFLGPKAENEEVLRELILGALSTHVAYRRAYHPEDPELITAQVKRRPEYRAAIESLKQHASELYERLTLSAPIFSMRSQGHMLWDQVLPAMAGYFAAMLYNQNNVAAEASPVTTRLEIEVGNDLCRMLGLHVSGENAKPGEIGAWGHITCDGSVANIEGLWAARNAKLYGVALRAALREAPALAAARNLEVRLLDGSKVRLAELDTWVALNLRIDDIVALPEALQERYGIAPETTAAALVPYSVQFIGMVDFYRRFMAEVPYAPVAFAPATRHYSWPKAAALLGLGQNNLLGVHVDLQARMQLPHLADLLELCLQRHMPVLAVVAVIGSTEESAVDPLRGILDLRESFRRRGLDFAVHCDAAWGGYFNSMLRREGGLHEALDEVPTFPMSGYVRTQYRALREADSITVDPHKAGYVPYPAGAVCYRNSALRDLISLKAPVVFHSQSEPTVGIYGVEGSKPGAAAAAVWLAHRVIRPDRDGYGKILGQCMWTSKRMYSRLVTLRDKRFVLVPFQMLPSERAGAPPREVERERSFIRKHFVGASNKQLAAFLRRNARARHLFMELGSDQVILAFAFNFHDAAGKLNASVKAINDLNFKIYQICSMTEPGRKPDLILTASDFDPASYGQPFVDHYCRRLGVNPEPGVAINFLISTTMDPWTTDTPRGSFLAVIEQTLRAVVHQAIDSLQKGARKK